MLQNIFKKRLSFSIQFRKKQAHINYGLIILVIIASVTTWWLTEYVVYQLKQMDSDIVSCVSEVRPTVKAQIGTPAFPGAEGAGATTPGGRGGKVLIVDRLDDPDTSNPPPGTLRWALTQPYPRIVVFRVGGTISINKSIRIREPYLTIVGQTAPGDGITVRNDPVRIETHDVIVRYVRFRLGESGQAAATEGDALELLGTVTGTPEDSDPDRNIYNVIIDHCSFSWGTDETVSFYNHKDVKTGLSYTRDITFQWNIISEPLHCSPLRPHTDCYNDPGFDGHSKAFLVGLNHDNISIHHNLTAHSKDRNPRIQDGQYEFINNFNYNVNPNLQIARTDNVCDNANPPTILNAIGNYALKSSGNRNILIGPAVCDPASCTSGYCSGDVSNLQHEVYVSDNVNVDLTKNEEWDVVSQGWGLTHPADKKWQSLAPYDFSGSARIPVTVQDHADANQAILERAGASLIRDAVDQRIIAEIRDCIDNNVCSTRIIDSPAFTDRGYTGVTHLSRTDYTKYGIPATTNDIADDGYPILASGASLADSDSDGMSDVWEAAHGLDPGTDDSSGYDLSSHYTNIEVYVNSLVSLLNCVDFDGDGYGVCPNCGTASGCTYDGNDCDDSEYWAHPGGTETCDTVDNNCSGASDEGCDDDSDGYCDSAMPVYRDNSMCQNTAPFTDGMNGDDCDDADNAVNPGASENCTNSTDDDCDGSIDAADADCNTTGCNTTYTVPIAMRTVDLSVFPNIGAGDCLNIEAGTRGPLIIENLKGNSANPIIIKNINGVVNIDANQEWVGLWMKNCEYISLTGTGYTGQEYGFNVSNSSQHGIVASVRSRYVEIDHTEVHDCTQEGIVAKTDEDIRSSWVQYDTHIHHNYVHDVGTEGFYIGSGQDWNTGTKPELHGVDLSYNRIERCGWDGLQLSSASQNVVIHDNYIADAGLSNSTAGGNGRFGLLMGRGSTGSWYNNVVINSRHAGFYSQGIGNFDFYNNLIVNSGYGETGKDGINYDLGDGGRIYFNTIVNSSGDGINIASYLSGGEIRDNIVAGYGSGNQAINNSTFTENNNLETNDINSMYFVDPANNDFHLSGNSPAVDQGDPVNYPDFDLDNVSRPHNSAPDIGAYEYVGFVNTTPCHRYTPTDPVSAGYGSAYNLAQNNTSELLIKTTCNANSVNLDVGNGNANMLIYQQGHIYDGSDWQGITLSGANQPYTGWYAGNAGAFSIPVANMSAINYIVAYTCYWNGQSWRCGCADSACIDPCPGTTCSGKTGGLWQLQTFSY